MSTAHPFDDLRLVRGRLLAQDRDDPGALRWVRETGAGPQVSFLLDRFLRLQDAELAAAREFAESWGPMHWQVVASDPGVVEVIAHESVPAWQSFGSRLEGILALAIDMRDRTRPKLSAWTEALLWSTPGVLPGDRERKRDDFAAGWGLDGFPTSTPDLWNLLRMLANLLLEQSGVRVDSGVGVGVNGAHYGLPSLVSIGSGDWPGNPVAIAGIGPLLALQAIAAIKEDRVFPCSACGRPVPIPRGGARPRSGIPFYGNHENCRHEARLNTMRRMYRRRKQQDEPRE